MIWVGDVGVCIRLWSRVVVLMGVGVVLCFSDEDCLIVGVIGVDWLVFWIVI